jgi:hypothetical protein
MGKQIRPQIRIKNAWLLYQNASVHINKSRRSPKKLPEVKDIDKIVTNYQRAWSKFENKIIPGMQKLLGVKFAQEIIDVYIAPEFNAFSDPMVIGSKFKPDYFVDILTHELLHRLLTDNNKVKNIDLMKEWKKIFGKNHNFAVLVHLPVHALHKSIWLDILKQPKRLKREREHMAKFKATDYIKSIDYIDKHDYREIISRLKSSYK